MHPTQNPSAATVDVEPTPAGLLRGAALYLQRHGWTQGRYYASTDVPTPPACVYGAIGMAAYGHVTDDPYSPERPERRGFTRAASVFLNHLKDDWFYDERYDEPTVGDWNDEADRTAEQVITALNDAADAWDHAHTPAVTNG